MKKAFLIVIHVILNALLEVIVRIGFPIIHRLLKRYQYTSSLHIPPAKHKHSILIHASSVGEINAVAPLVQALGSELITINTITISGRDHARKMFPNVQCEIAPLDIYSLRKKQMQELLPKLIIIVETEIWPNMLIAARNHDIPVVFVNARMSETSLKRYKLIHAYMAYLNTSVCEVLAQSDADAERFSQLWDCKVMNVGNLKFAISLPSFDVNELRQRMGLSPDSFVICFGSTRPGEEELLLKYLPKLKNSIPKLKVILAPRHPKRSDEVEALFQECQIQRLSSLVPEMPWDVLLIDTLGHLASCYAICDIAMVGGSFYDFGGHNPLEPAFYAKPIIYGTHFSSCRDSIAALKSKDAVIISDNESLLLHLTRLYQDSQYRLEMGKRAKEVLSQNDSALKITLQEINKCQNR